LALGLDGTQGEAWAGGEVQWVGGHPISSCAVPSHLGDWEQRWGSRDNCFPVTDGENEAPVWDLKSEVHAPSTVTYISPVLSEDGLCPFIPPFLPWPME
jgi:hypothetical protein